MKVESTKEREFRARWCRSWVGIGVALSCLLPVGERGRCRAAEPRGPSAADTVRAELPPLLSERDVRRGLTGRLQGMRKRHEARQLRRRRRSRGRDAQQEGAVLDAPALPRAPAARPDAQDLEQADGAERGQRPSREGRP